MQIKFNNVKLKNFLSFEDAYIDLNNVGYTLVSGINNNPDDMAKSNGSGKSALWEAISWSITGETIRGIKDVKRIGSAEKDKCFVELNFDIDGKNYRLIRSKTPSNLEFYEGEKNLSGKGIRDTEKIVENYLPDLTASLIGSVVILGQGLPQRFTNNTPSGRKEVLEKLSKSDYMISDMKERISNRLKTLYTKDEGFAVNIATLSGKQSTIENEIVNLNNRIEDIKSLGNIDEEIEVAKQNESVQENLLKDLEEKLNKSKEVLNNNLQIKATINAEQELELNKVASKYTAIINDYNREKDKFVITADSIKSEINKLKSIKDVCPTCGQKIPGVLKPDTKALEDELQQAEVDIVSVDRDIKITKSEWEKDYQSVKGNYKDKINENKEAVEISENDVKNNQTDYNYAKLLYDKAYRYRLSLESKRDSNKDKVDELYQDIERYNNQLVELDKEILYNNKEKESNLLHISVINKFNSIVTRDFRGYLLKSIIDYIDIKSKEYSQIVFETNKLNFQLDGNNISINYDDKPYEALSGGEKQKVDLIVQFAIRDMLCKYLGFSSNIIVLDEIFDNLDAQGCQNILNLISSKLNDVQSIFIITHHSDISIPADYEINVVKGADKISRIS